MDVVRLHANLPTRTAAAFEAAFARALTANGVALPLAWLVDVGQERMVAGQRIALDVGFGGHVQCRALGLVTRVDSDVVHVEVNDADEVWVALAQGRSRSARPALLVSEPDAFAVDDVPPPAIQHIDLAHREALLARMLAGGADDTIEGDEPGLSDEGSTASGPVRPAPILFDLPDVVGAADASPPPGCEDEAPRVFERQSTDIDLLGEISASDVIALDELSVEHGAHSANDNDHDDNDNDDDLVDLPLADLPSMDAELLDDDTLALPTLLALRPLPPPSSDDVSDGSPVVVASAWTVSRRGVPLALEHFGWPHTGTRREVVPQAPDVDDGDVFSTPKTPVQADPYAARDSDPSLDVEDIVARNTSVADIFADSDDDLFRTGDDDVTRDEMPLPRLSSPPPPPPLVDVHTNVFHHDSSDERSAG